MKCIIADYMHEKTSDLLEAIGLEVNYQPKITTEELKQQLSGYDGLVIRSKAVVDEKLIGNATLKFIARAGAGMDNIDEGYLLKKGIAIINAPEGNRNALAEHALGMLLSLLNHINTGNKEIREGLWLREKNRGYELADKTVGLLGYGYMGQAFAKKLSALGCRVIAFDKYKNLYTDKYCLQVSQEDLFKQTDIFSIHVPLTSETKKMVDLNYLNRFKKDIWLINTSRGGVLSIQGLCKALEMGKVRGAALDVLENEQLDALTQEQEYAFNCLKKADNVIFTPHVAGWSYESYYKISQVIADKIAAAFFRNN